MRFYWSGVAFSYIYHYARQADTSKQLRTRKEITWHQTCILGDHRAIHGEWRGSYFGDNAMEEQKKTETPAAAGNTRRTVLKTAAQVAVTAPAVGLLLSAATKPAMAQDAYQATQQHILDDFTTGNTHEDIDGCKGFGLTQDDTPGGPGCAVGNTVGDI
jgi:hypothetical protein